MLLWVKCRTSNVIYRCTCLETEKKYTGNTSRHGKTRCGEHCDDVRAQCRGQKSDSFSEHFYRIWKKVNGNDVPSRKDIRKLFRYETLWIGNNVLLNKGYGTSRCGLCARERMELLKLSDCLRDTSKLINYKSEIFFSCRHKPKILNFIKVV